MRDDLLRHLREIADDELELTPSQRDFAVQAAARIYLQVGDAGLDLAIDTIAQHVAQDIDFLVDAASRSDVETQDVP